MKPKREPDGKHFVTIREVETAPTILWELLEEREPFQNISHKQMPTPEEHLAFVSRHPYRIWYLIKDGPHFVGSAYLTKRHEVGIWIYREHRGKGYGKWAVCELARRFRERPLLANIAPGNADSKAFFEHLGFNCIQHTYECDVRSLSPS